MTSEIKAKNYQECFRKLEALLAGESDQIVIMASISSVLGQAFEHFYWTGFYRMLHGELVVGPYQGTPACLRISIGKGVCGTVAQTGVTEVVDDVHAFPGHIACDAASESEIVVPVKDSDSGKLLAVLDIDSTTKASFDEVDKKYLEMVITHFF